jgi:hypothetical protein
MTQEEIIELANKAHAYIDRRFMVASSTGIASFEHFARLVAEREREECAKVCEAQWGIDGQHTANEFAAAVRARGQE